jgi:hypothetical protein
MLAKLTEIYNLPFDNSKQYGLREIFINPTSVCMIRLEPAMQKYLAEGRLPSGLDKRNEFSRITISGGTHSSSLVVVGAPYTIEQKLKETKQLLKG